MTLRTKLEDLRKTPSLAPTAAEYRALIELALAVDRWDSAVSAIKEAERAESGNVSPLFYEARSAYPEVRAALARLAEAVR